MHKKARKLTAEPVLVYGAPFFDPDLEVCPYCGQCAVNMRRPIKREFGVIYCCESCGKFSQVA